MKWHSFTYKILAVTTIFLLSETIHAQQKPMYSQYMFNMLNINPAYAGSREPTPFEIPTVEIFVPGGFSPNQDGMNDYFVIRRPSQTIIQLEVFNRWGNLIYRSADYKNDWNGRTNQPGNILGPEIPDGTYYYIITGNDRATGRVTRLNGFITVKR